MACVSLSDHRDTETADIICAERPCEVRNYAGKKAESLYRELYRVYEKSDRWNPEEMAAVDCGEPGTDYHTERYAYNHRGQLTCVMPDGGTGANYEYDNNGALIRTECHNGLTTTYAYDSRGRLESLKAGFAGETALLDAKYAYDGNGNRTGEEEKLFMQNGKRAWNLPVYAVYL